MIPDLENNYLLLTFFKSPDIYPIPNEKASGIRILISRIVAVKYVTKPIIESSLKPHIRKIAVSEKKKKKCFF